MMGGGDDGVEVRMMGHVGLGEMGTWGYPCISVCVITKIY